MTRIKSRWRGNQGRVQTAGRRNDSSSSEDSRDDRQVVLELIEVLRCRRSCLVERIQERRIMWSEGKLGNIVGEVEICAVSPWTRRFTNGDLLACSKCWAPNSAYPCPRAVICQSPCTLLPSRLPYIRHASAVSPLLSLGPLGNFLPPSRICHSTWLTCWSSSSADLRSWFSSFRSM